jgi:hypothetical protein
VLTVMVGEEELAEIARAGYVEAASTDRKDREAAVNLFPERRGQGADAMTRSRRARDSAASATRAIPLFRAGVAMGAFFVVSLSLCPARTPAAPRRGFLAGPVVEPG